jgi:demethylmenaquinone methyltransferase/2-methoxy-6-polyprenyl-1,4-benzoquinol methylase
MTTMSLDRKKRIYFDELAPRWDQMPWPPDTVERVAWFCQRACPVDTGRVLDVGCGTGLLGKHVLATQDAGSTLVELDFAPSMLAEARRKIGDDRAVAVCADAVRLPFRASQFEAVLCFGILPHLGDPGVAVAELWRVVRPGGVLAVGHLLGSKQLNEKHRSIGGPVSDDMLVPAAQLATLLAELGATVVTADDRPDGYFVKASRS